MMDIRYENNGKKGQFVAIENDTEAGLMTFTWAGEHLMIIDHTEVNEAFNGKGVGKALVYAAVEKARQESFKILPLCPFAKATFDRNKDLDDIRHR